MVRVAKFILLDSLKPSIVTFHFDYLKTTSVIFPFDYLKAHFGYLKTHFDYLKASSVICRFDYLKAHFGYLKPSFSVPLLDYLKASFATSFYMLIIFELSYRCLVVRRRLFFFGFRTYKPAKRKG